MPDVEFGRDGNLGIVVISRPPLNLFTWELLSQLGDVVTHAATAPIRALLLRAEGAHFSAGADVARMFQDISVSQAESLLSKYLNVMHQLEQLPFPTMAVTQGMCFTAGLEVALRCDILWAGLNTKFGQLESSIGTTTLLGGAQILSQRAGPARAREICYSSEIYEASTFERWGIVNRVLSDPDLQESSLSFAHKLANGPTRALHATKQLVKAAAEEGTAAADDLISTLGSELFGTEDMQSGVASLVKYGARDFRDKISFHGL